VTPQSERVSTPTGRWRPWRILVMLVIAIALVACGGPPGLDGDIDGDPPAGNGSGDNGGSDGNGAPNRGSAEGPITATLESGTYGFTVGRCEIIDDVVYVTASGGGMTGAFEATLPEWERDTPYSWRESRVSMTNFGSSTGDNFELVASRNDPGTTWDWTVSGSVVEIVARMGDRMTANREDGAERFTEYRDVTFHIQCAGGVFGSGPDAERFAQHQFPILQDPMQRVPGRVTVEIEGGTYEITYLTTCQFFQDQVTVEGLANEADVWLYSEGAGVLLDFAIGDRRDEFTDVGVERWSLPPDAQLQDDFQFEGSDTVRSWSGTVVAEDGSETEATITVECTEGDLFESAGTGSIVLDGVTHTLDDVMSCTIDGTMIDFFGRARESDVAVVVTGGGSEILLADEAGQQTATRDVEFDLSGQRATWTGVLAGDRQATVVIDCG
jgi:hypothetical protein